MMLNAFHELKAAIRQQNVEADELIQALMATVYLECCDGCGSKLHSDEFLEAFRRMLSEMKLTAELSRTLAA